MRNTCNKEKVENAGNIGIGVWGVRWEMEDIGIGGEGRR